MQDKQSLRPLQHVLYLSEKIEKKLNWNAKTVVSLLDLDTISRFLGDDQLLLLCALNSIDTKSGGCYSPSGLPSPVGSEVLLSAWRQSATSECAQEALSRIKSNLSLSAQNKAIQNSYEIADNELAPVDKPYKIVHDEQVIGIVLSNEFNLNDKSTVSQVSNDIIGDVVRIYSLYHPPETIATNDWFKVYISNL